MAQLSEKRLFLLDMDGTIYLDERLFDGVPEFLRYVRRVGGRYLFLTNNSSRGVEGYIEKLHRLGIDTAPGGLSDLRGRHHPLSAGEPAREGSAMCAGTASFMDQLAQAGIPVTRDREQAEVLLCGFDTELTFQKLEDACILLDRGVPFIATNPDWVCPTWYGSVPDCGSVCRMLTTATGREPAVHRQAPAGDGAAGHGADGLFPGADGAAGGPALYRHRLRRQRRHRHRVRPVRRGHAGGYRRLSDPPHLGVSRHRYPVPGTGGDCMKLNYKRTILVGFAFFLICAFWQAYDNTIPLILTNKFGMSQAWSGAIMALDNVLALFMLPLFGAISDKHHSKWGRRTPFIVVGTLIAAVMLIALSFVDNAQLHHICRRGRHRRPGGAGDHLRPGGG